MKLSEIEDREGLQIDSERLKSHNSKQNKNFKEILNLFIGDMILNDDEIRILYKYNEFLREYFQRL